MNRPISDDAADAERAPIEAGALQPAEGIAPVMAPRARRAKRALLVASTGFILMYFSELVFWGSYDPVGMAPWQFGLTWFGYSGVAYGFLAVVHYFRVCTIWSLFIAGAAYGWMLEGVLAQTLYGSEGFVFPITISWTALAWHSLISVLAGWYGVRKTLLRNDCRRTIGVGILLGLFYGVWAFSWSLEPGHRVMALVEQGHKDVALVHFVLYTFLTSALLVLSYWAYDSAQPAGFRPSLVVVSALGAIAPLIFLVTTARLRPVTSLVLPVLLGMAYVALRRNRDSETRRDLVAGLHGRVRTANYCCLLFMPLVASILYGLALAADVRLPTGVFIFVVSTCVGAVMFAVSMVKVLRKGRGPRDVHTATAG
jgi:hypothetical protein